MPTDTAIMLLLADMQRQLEQYKTLVQELQTQLQTKEGEVLALIEDATAPKPAA